MRRYFTRATRVSCISAAAFLFVVVAAALDYRPAQAAGAFVVNTSADNNVADSLLSLREAILVANGTLTASLTAGEMAQLGGCTFSGNSISGGCGKGITDTITFAFTTTEITLETSLPPLNDTRPTHLQGPGSSLAEVAIDGTKLTASAFVLSVHSAENLIEHLTFRNGAVQGAGINIEGNLTTVRFVRVYGNGGAGIKIDGALGTRVYNSSLGFRDLDAFPTCSAGKRNDGPNILLTGGTTYSEIDGVSSGCSPGDGILITGTTTLSNSVVYGYHGTWYHAGGLYYLGNAGAGVAVRGGSDGNLIEYNIIANNQDGVVIAGAGSDRNVVHDNDIGRYILAVVPNTRHGVLIEGGLDTQVLTNSVAENAQSGIVISSTTNNRAVVAGNSVYHQHANGIMLAGNTGLNTLRDNNVYANGGYGILLTGTSMLNGISGGAIYDNGGAGIAEGGSAGANLWSRLSMYGNRGLGIDKKADGVPAGPYPVIQSYVRAASGITVTGVASPSLTVELYRVAADPSGYGEGKQYVGETVADGTGRWRIADPAGPGCYTAQMYGVVGMFFPFASEFARNTPCVFLPLLSR